LLDKNKIYLGDNIELLKQLEDESIHSVVSDFPYGLEFMGKEWDSFSNNTNSALGGQSPANVNSKEFKKRGKPIAGWCQKDREAYKNYYNWCYERAEELFRVLKTGGYALIFGGTRTHHRLTCALEDAGFIIKDEIAWMYGSGFPKSYNISKGFDKQAGAEREVVGEYIHPDGKPRHLKNHSANADVRVADQNWGLKESGFQPITAPTTDLARQWDGWGTCLKPAHEPIIVAQKPYENGYCYNIEKYGVGGLNIDGCRIETDELKNKIWNNGSQRVGTGGSPAGSKDFHYSNGCVTGNSIGRFPANLILDEEAGKILDEQSEGASRFFYCAKANKKDKTEDGKVENKHPTVKPTNLIKYLVKLVTPPEGTCLDICEGSGTHAKACILLTKEDYPVNYIGFENDEESYNISLERVKCNL
jgi:site-specific DNA-methyltransferase (adenine-specific)